MNIQKGWAMIIGIVLVLVGLIGFFNDPILSLFDVNVAHNMVHLLTGAVFLWAGFSRKAPAMKVNQWIGIIYILVAIVGFLGYLTFLDVGAGLDYDNFLHLGIGLVSAIIGWAVK